MLLRGFRRLGFYFARKPIPRLCARVADMYGDMITEAPPLWDRGPLKDTGSPTLNWLNDENPVSDDNATSEG